LKRSEYGHEERRERLPSALGLLVAGDVLGVGLLEEPAFVAVLAGRVVVFEREQAVSWRAGLRPWVGVDMPAARAGAAVSVGRAIEDQG